MSKVEMWARIAWFKLFYKSTSISTKPIKPRYKWAMVIRISHVLQGAKCGNCKWAGYHKHKQHKGIPELLYCNKFGTFYVWYENEYCSLWKRKYKEEGQKKEKSGNWKKP